MLKLQGNIHNFQDMHTTMVLLLEHIQSEYNNSNLNNLHIYLLLVYYNLIENIKLANK